MAEEDDRAKQATSRVVVALRRAAGDGVRPVGRLALHFTALQLNEPNHTIKLRNAGMQFVALRSLEAALHVIKSGWNHVVGTPAPPRSCEGRTTEVDLLNSYAGIYNHKINFEVDLQSTLDRRTIKIVCLRALVAE